MAGTNGVGSVGTLDWAAINPNKTDQSPLSKSFEELVQQGYGFFGAGDKKPRNAAEAMNCCKSGGLETTRKGSDFRWALETPDKFMEFVFGETGQIDHLPENTRRQFQLLQRLKNAGGDKMFFSKPSKKGPDGREVNRTCILVKAAPIWKCREGSPLYAEFNGGPREQVTDLEAFAAKHGVSLNAQSAAAAPAPAASSAPIWTPPPPAAAPAEAPPPPPAAQEAPPPPPAAPAAPPVVTLEDLAKAARTEPAVMAEVPPAAPPQAEAPPAAPPQAEAPPTPQAEAPPAAPPQAEAPPAAPPQAEAPPAAPPQAEAPPAAPPQAEAPPAAPPQAEAPPAAPPQAEAPPAPAPAAAPPKPASSTAPAPPDGAQAEKVTAAAAAKAAPAPPPPVPPPGPRIVSYEQLKREQAAAEPPAPPPPPAPEDRAPNFFGGNIIAPSNMPEPGTVAKTRKVKGPDGPGTVVMQEMMFILPPGQDRLTKVPVAPSKVLANTLRRSGVGFIYMTVFAPSAGKLETFQKKHPVVSKLLDTNTGTIPGSMGRNRTNGKEKVYELLVSMPADKEFKTEIVHFPPDLDLANALALHNYPIAYVNCSAPDGKTFEKIKDFLKDGQFGTRESAA